MEFVIISAEREMIQTVDGRIKRLLVVPLRAIHADPLEFNMTEEIMPTWTRHINFLSERNIRADGMVWSHSYGRMYPIRAMTADEDIMRAKYHTPRVKVPQEKPAERKPPAWLSGMLLYGENERQIARSLEAAGGVSEAVLSEPGVREFLASLATNSIHVTAEYRK